MVAHSRVEATPDMQPLLDRVLRGEQITITRGGVEVAVLHPLQTRVKSPEESARIVREMQEFSAGRSLGGLKVRELRDEGRP